MPRPLSDRKHVNYLPSHKSYCAWSSLCMSQPVNIQTTVDKKQNKILESTICSLYFWHTCDLEIIQGHQTFGDNVDPKQGYNQAKFKTSRYKNVRENKATSNLFLCLFVFKRASMTVVSLEPVRKSKIVVHSRSTWRNQQSYKVST